VCVADFGVVPIENFQRGKRSITRLDMFLTSGPEKSAAKWELRISHYLMGKMSGFEAIKNGFVRTLKRLAQCRAWLDEQLPRGGADRRIQQTPKARGRARDERGTAAIAGRAAAGDLCAENCWPTRIEGSCRINTTRFLVVGRKLFSAKRRPDRTTLLGIDQRHR